MDAETGLFGESFRVHSYKQVHIGPEASPVPDNLSWSARRDMERLERIYAGAVWPATATETAWRHGSWSKDRERVLRALRASGRPAHRIERFECCGSGARIEIEKKSGRVRVRSSNCGDRFCNPCVRGRAGVVRRRLDSLDRGKAKQFITFTIQNEGRTLVESVNHLLESFAKVRRAKVFADNIEGGVGCVETKRGENSGGWHTHLHSICVTNWVPWGDLRAAWFKATGDSFIIDAEEPRDKDRVGFYCTKYVGKGFDRSILSCHDDLCECICGLSGRRLLVPFGSWYARCRDAEDQERGDWVGHGSLESLLVKRDAGDAWANVVLADLTKGREKLAAAWARCPTE